MVRYGPARHGRPRWGPVWSGQVRLVVVCRGMARFGMGFIG